MNVILRGRKKVHRTFPNFNLDYSITQCGVIVHDMDHYTEKSVTCRRCIRIEERREKYG